MAIPSQISLGPLTADSFEQLMVQLLPDLDDDARHRLLDAAEGNPFFAEEIARARDEGVDATAAEGVFVPDTARAALAARIDRLGVADREVLQDAAVIGEVFWPDPLIRIRGEDVRPSLATLERRGFIATRPTTSLPGQREIAFHHGLMREVAYQSISRRRLAATHAAVAEWTEELASDRRDEFIEVVAHHYAAAAQPETAGLAWLDDPPRREHIREKAIEALVGAGHAAHRRFSTDQAVDYADRALALAETERERLRALELKAAAYHAAARVDEAWSVYLDAVTAARGVGEETDISRVVTEATLLWARYGGAFTTEDWKPTAIDIVQTRLDEIGEEEETAELAALLTGRSVWGRRALFDRTPEQVKADAQRAISISERLGSNRLLSHALDAYGMSLRSQGFCGLGDLADRMVQLGAEMPDRRQSHEMRISSAIALAEIGRYRDSRAVASVAHADAQAMSVHQRIHGIAALTGSMVPNGEFAEVLSTSDDLFDLIVEDGGHICEFGGGGVVGRTLALFEQGAGEPATEFFEATLPGVQALSIIPLQLIERVRPFIGVERAERLLEEAHDSTEASYGLYAIRAQLPIAVSKADWPQAEALILRAREFAETCCAPQLVVFADWAESVREGSVRGAEQALASLNEPYTAARLAVDFLGLVPGQAGAALRTETERSLESMDARASLAELRGS
jgi:tetratricopeptide (TPR) repeat protein